MVVECPHCYGRVIPDSNGCCPACRKDVNDTTGAELDKTVMTVFESDQFPAMCFLCGATTDRVQPCSFRETGEQPNWFLVVLGALTASVLAAAQLSKAFRWRRQIDLKLPQCEGCAGEVVARRGDLEKGQVELLVHRAFRDRVRAWREGAAA